MKKVVRLTESDLTRIVKRVINEKKDMIRITGDYSGAKHVLGGSASPEDIMDEYNNAVTTGLPEPDQKKIKNKLDETNQKVNVLTRKIPYVIYLPIYDFQFIKIIPKRIKGDMFKPDPVKNF